MYDIIKRQNGEAFAKAIRNYNSSIFDIENLPQIVRYAGRNPFPVLGYLNQLADKNVQQPKESRTVQDPFELLKKAGYNAFYVDSLEKQNAIRPYFAGGEELCTFEDETRYQKYHVIHAIKEGADKLKREDFLGKEEREDEYGTSVISIQILKEGGFIKITNRYNHTVDGCDNTFNSNPDNIIKGLSLALKDYFDVDFQCIDSPFIVCNQNIYKYHGERYNVYYGDSYYIKDSVPYFINKDYQMVVDNFILDFKENKILVPHAKDKEHYVNTALCDLIQNEIQDKKVTAIRQDGQTFVYADNQLILKVRENALTYLNLKTKGYKITDEDNVLNVKELYGPSDSIFFDHEKIEEIYLDNITFLPDHSIVNCPNLRVFSSRNLMVMADHCLQDNPFLSVAEFDSLKEVGYRSFRECGFKKIELNQLEKLTQDCFCSLPLVEEILLPNVKGDDFDCFLDNPKLKKLLAQNADLLSASYYFKLLPSLEVVESRMTNGPMMRPVQPHNSNKRTAFSKQKGRF